MPLWFCARPHMGACAWTRVHMRSLLVLGVRANPRPLKCCYPQNLSKSKEQINTFEERLKSTTVELQKAQMDLMAKKGEACARRVVARIVAWEHTAGISTGRR